MDGLSGNAKKREWWQNKKRNYGENLVSEEDIGRHEG